MPPKSPIAPTFHIDWTRCDGHGTCADLLPELVSRDDWGYPIIQQGVAITNAQRSRANLAVEVCPMMALRITI